MTPKLLVDDNSNAAQRYLTHSMFRYYGKYPPTSTRMLLEILLERGAMGPVVDIMCGSGTTLLETAILSQPAIGIDVNPIAVLASKVKVERCKPEELERHLGWVHSAVRGAIGRTFNLETSLFRSSGDSPLKVDCAAVDDILAQVMAKVGRWFTQEAAIEHAALRVVLGALPDSPASRAMKLAWLRTIRRTSRASARTGRLFLDKQKTPPLPFDVYAKECFRIAKLQAQLPTFEFPIRVIQGSALFLSSLVEPITTVFWHPPYFALYKYSSDVLRLELEWLGSDRKAIASKEIRDGFKTSNPKDVEKYLDDCGAVWQELYRACAPHALAVNADSTLAEKRLGIFSRFAKLAESAGFRVLDVFRRRTTGTAATYHRSANKNIRTREDFIVLFEKPGQ